MMKAKWAVAAAVTAATLTNGCMAFQEPFGHGRGSSSSSDGSHGAIADDKLTGIDDDASRPDDTASRPDDAAKRLDDAAKRSEAAANRAAATASRASMAAEKTETGFHKGLNK